MSTSQELRNREARLRRRAKKQGFYFSKAEVFDDPEYDMDFFRENRYYLLDPRADRWVVGGADCGGPLDAVEHWLDMTDEERLASMTPQQRRFYEMALAEKEAKNQ